MAGRVRRSFSLPPLSASGPSVVSVARLSIARARWTFTDTVTGVVDASGLKVNAEVPDTVAGFSGTHVDIDYTDDMTSGDPWTLTAGTGARINFTGGGTLSSQVGTIT